MQIDPLRVRDLYSASRATLDDATDQTTFAAIAAEFDERLRTGEATARAAMIGKADPHALVEALASMQSAVETVATVRDRVVEAYQEILRMPI